MCVMLQVRETISDNCFMACPDTKLLPDFAKDEQHGILSSSLQRQMFAKSSFTLNIP